MTTAVKISDEFDVVNINISTADHHKTVKLGSMFFAKCTIVSTINNNISVNIDLKNKRHHLWSSLEILKGGNSAKEKFDLTANDLMRYL